MKSVLSPAPLGRISSTFIGPRKSEGSPIIQTPSVSVPTPAPAQDEGGGPEGITKGSYKAQDLTQSQRQWLWEQFGHSGEAPVGYGGESTEEQKSDPVKAAEDLENELTDILIELDEKLSAIPLHITDEEREAFLQSAIEQITPYYDKKKLEIEAGIKEGKIRTAEDVLTEIRAVREESTVLLEKWDIEKAETEEDFINTISDITATKDEDIAAKREDWRKTYWF